MSRVRNQVDPDVMRLVVVGGWGVDGWVDGCGEAQPGWVVLVSSLRGRSCSRRAVIIMQHHCQGVQAGYKVVTSDQMGGFVPVSLMSVVRCGQLLADFCDRSLTCDRHLAKLQSAVPVRDVDSRSGWVRTGPGVRSGLSGPADVRRR
jgi:hypothetical protein